MKYNTNFPDELVRDLARSHTDKFVLGLDLGLQSAVVFERNGFATVDEAIAVAARLAMKTDVFYEEFIASLHRSDIEATQALFIGTTEGARYAIEQQQLEVSL